MLEAKPDATVVTDGTLRRAIEATGFPWRVRDRVTGIEMLLVPPGAFRRGLSPDDAEGASKRGEQPAHDVRITRPFYLGRYEVTQSEWAKVTGRNPSRHARTGRFPVDYVTFDDVQEFCANASSGLRLPTEAEWEYACRAGTSTAHYGELDEIAWHHANSGYVVHEVGGKRANALGFHDMLGNVMEWCADFYDDAEYERCRGGVTDPIGPATGTERVLRGGTWGTGISSFCRASDRNRAEPRGTSYYVGCRVARSP